MKSWRSVEVRECLFSARTLSALQKEFRWDVTLGQVADEGDTALLRLPGFGAKSLAEVRERIAGFERTTDLLGVPADVADMVEWAIQHENLMRALMGGEAVIVPADALS